MCQLCYFELTIAEKLSRVYNKSVNGINRGG